MPKWKHHKNIAKILKINLPNRIMDFIDSKLDGISGDYEHDFWKHDYESLREVLSGIYNSYGVVGVKYALLHIFLDKMQAYTVSEKTRGGLRTESMRIYAHEFAFEYVIGSMKYYKEHIKEYAEIIDEFIREVTDKRNEITNIIDKLPEVETQIKNIENFKYKAEKAREIAIRFGATSYDIIIYSNFILELWNDKKRGNKSKEEWAKEVINKRIKLLEKTVKKTYLEKLYNDFTNIARNLGYLK